MANKAITPATMYRHGFRIAWSQYQVSEEMIRQSV
jgi:hypothetical protein